jgi:hypothetical protein
MKKLIAEIIIYILGAGSALTIQPADHSEWVDIEFPDGTPSIQGEVSYRWEQDGMEHIVLMDGHEYVIEKEYVDFH